MNANAMFCTGDGIQNWFALADCDTNCYSYPYEYANLDADRDSNSNPNCHSYGYCHSNSNGNRYTDFNTAASKQLPLPDFCQPR